MKPTSIRFDDRRLLEQVPSIAGTGIFLETKQLNLLSGILTAMTYQRASEYEALTTPQAGYIRRDTRFACSHSLFLIPITIHKLAQDRGFT